MVAARLLAQLAAHDPDDGGMGYLVGMASQFCGGTPSGDPPPIPAGYLSGLRDALRRMGVMPVA